MLKLRVKGFSQQTVVVKFTAGNINKSRGAILKAWEGN